MKLFHVVGKTLYNGEWVTFHSRPVSKRLAKRHRNKFASPKLKPRHKKMKVVKVKVAISWPTLETATNLEANNKRLGLPA